MFIHRLHLQNFRSHRDTSFAFGKINLIRGPNNSGKSSLGQAIEMLLTGRCLGLDEAGRGAESLIESGWKQTTITATIGCPESVDGELTRTRSNGSGNVVMKPNSGHVFAGKQVEEWLEKKSWSKDIISAALRAGRFISLSPTDQKELLADILRPEALPVYKEIQEAMGKCFAGFIIEQIDLEGARELEERAIKLRAECTAALRELGEPEPPQELSKKAPSLKEVEGKLNSLRSEQNTITREKEKLENAWAERSRARRELPAQIKVLQAKILSEADEKNYMEAIDHESDRTKAAQELYRISAQIHELKAQAESAKTKEGKCPTCFQQIDAEDLVSRLQKSIGAMESRIPTLEGILDKYPTAADARNALRIHREAVTDAERLKKELAEIGDPKRDVLPDTKGHQEKIDALEERIRRGQSVLSDLAAHVQASAQYESLSKRRLDIETRREAADTLAKWAGPSGIQAQMSSGKIGPFTDAINSVLRRFGYTCKFTLDPYSIEVGRLDGNANLELASLSESEQWRFSMGFQAAVAVSTGLKLIVLDRADVLVGPNRGIALKTLLGCGLEQIFVLASVDTKAKLPDDFRVFDLKLDEDGCTIIE